MYGISMVHLTEDTRNFLPKDVTPIIFPLGLEVNICHAFRFGCNGL